MKAIVLRHPGGPSALSYEDVPTPKVRDGWTLLKVKGFGINRSEIFTRNGWSPSVKLPRILGIECVGEVVETTDSDHLLKGQIVVSVMGGMGRVFNGSYAEYVLLSNKQIYSVNTKLTISDLSAVPETYGTAYGSLLKLQLDDADELKSVGFDEVVLDQDNQLQTGDQKFDRILELVGALTLPNSMKFIQPNGITCVTGELGGVWDLTHFEPISQLNGGYLTSFESGALDQRMFDDLFDIINSSHIDVAPTKVFDLKHTADAQAYLDSHDSFGKVVVLS